MTSSPLSSADLTDEELMLRVARHDEDAALAELIRRYRAALVNHFARRGVQHEYEDLAQETFLRLYKARRRYRVEALFRTYLYHIAHRVWIDHLRKHGRRERRENAFRAEPRPDQAEAPALARADLRWAMAQLPRGHRDVVAFSLLDELSHGEIAAQLGIPEGTVKSRLHHALRRLRDILEGDLA